jgi:predicted O-methyltransferase YrrM
MLALVKNILETRTVEDQEGNKFPLHSETNIQQCEFLQKIMEKVDASLCIEIGLAYGMSSLHICEYLARKNSPRFISIDPYQSDWNDIGLFNLKKCGFDRFTEFHRDFSHNVLPKLLVSGLRIDFAYVDTCKIFDVVLLDAVYLTRLLKVGGMLVFDDCDRPGIKRMARYIAKWPHLRVAARHGEVAAGLKRRSLSRLARMLPSRERIFRDDLLFLDEAYGVNAGCVAFEKLDEDTRKWDWNVAF